MNITREVVTDLLPIYFSGEASNDTKLLVEEYFHENPDFERMALSAGTPLETLRTAPPVTAGSERDKRDLESVRCRLDRRKWLFAVSLFLTLSPLFFYFTHGHLVSLKLGDALWEAGLDWSMAALFWFLYIARLPWRTAHLVTAVSLMLIPIPFALHVANAPGQKGGLRRDLRRGNMHLDYGGIDLDWLLPPALSLERLRFAPDQGLEIY